MDNKTRGAVINAGHIVFVGPWLLVLAYKGIGVPGWMRITTAITAVGVIAFHGKLGYDKVM